MARGCLPGLASFFFFPSHFVSPGGRLSNLESLDGLLFLEMLLPDWHCSNALPGQTPDGEVIRRLRLPSAL